ncbi:uncharacterized protein PV07_01377 [Cladophialophora immunda]|uniref:Uncharacterized protein n=1 Tax=Cladophialophora immunda TaxID=569365 RepID=A0A0D2CTW8_9EURO|nr:uncharacterized protein PV07_01377 [Cladophialophora immunda]KIW34603.1 hypothetical protein PV07_01377 [Cladophialophora immunda]
MAHFDDAHNTLHFDSLRDVLPSAPSSPSFQPTAASDQAMLMQTLDDKIEEGTDNITLSRAEAVRLRRILATTTAQVHDSVVSELAAAKQELAEMKVFARLGDYAGCLANALLKTETGRQWKRGQSQVVDVVAAVEKMEPDSKDKGL